jgi:hypothetical protein
MIGVPFDNNDLTCLSAISEIMAELVERRDPLLLDLAQNYPTPAALAAWIRSLPQRDDEGLPGDGPKVEACEPVQRLRVPAPDPNCLERAALYLAAAELIDPAPVRQLATLDFPWGRHTFPIENGAPVVLDPVVGAEELAQGMANEGLAQPADTQQRNAGPVVVDVNDALEYTAQLAEERTRDLRNGPSLTWLARNAIRTALDSGIPPDDPKTLDAMGWFFAHAEDAARGYGRRALTIVRTTAAAITDLIDDLLAREQRNLSLEIAGNRYDVPSWLSDAVGTVGKIGLDLGTAYLRPHLLDAGITGEMLQLVEQELNAEGFSLGPLSKQGQSISSALASIANKSHKS